MQQKRLSVRVPLPPGLSSEQVVELSGRAIDEPVYLNGYGKVGKVRSAGAANGEAPFLALDIELDDDVGKIFSAPVEHFSARVEGKG